MREYQFAFQEWCFSWRMTFHLDSVEEAWELAEKLGALGVIEVINNDQEAVLW